MSAAEWFSQFSGVMVDLRLGIVALSTMLAGFLRGFIGFGAALVTIPIISLAYGPLVALPVVTIMGLPSVLQLLPDAIRHSEWPIVVPISAAVFIGAPLGTLVLVSIDPNLMKIVISVLVVAMVGFLAMRWQLKQKVPRSLLLASGLAGGLVQGAAGIGGPPVVAVALSRAGSPERQRGNVLALMTAIALSSLPPLLWHGLFTQGAVVIGLLLLPLYSAGTWLGSHFFSRGGQPYFRPAALVFLAIIGLATLVVASWEYFGVE